MRQVLPPRKSSPLSLAAVGLASLLFPSSSALADAPPAPPAAAAPPPAVDRFDSFFAQAQKLAASEQHFEALRAYQAAYALRQRPLVLLQIARTQHKLGLAAEASESYRRYLTAEQDPQSETRAEAERALSSLQALLPPPPVPAAPRLALGLDDLNYRVVNRPYNAAMRNTGIVLFSVGYGAALISGLTMGPLYYHAGSSSSGISTSAFCLLIPVAGPFVSGIVAPVSTGDDLYALVWSLPWILTSGALQAIGVGLWGGAYRSPQSVLVPREPLTSLRVAPYMSPDSAGLVAGLRF